MYGSSNGDSTEKLKGLRISSLDDEDDDKNDDVLEGRQVGDEEEDYDNDDEEEEDEDEDEEPVTLGFAEKPENRWSLLRHLFPSKAGGVPAWLDPINLPNGKSSACDICGEPLQFLLQVYAPVSEKESAFHRTLFVFMCTKMSCLLRDQHEQWKRKPELPLRSVKVFRCQLSRFNPFYSSEPPKHNGTDKPSGPGAKLCNWCGTWKGDKVCSRCKKAHYCSKKHQDMHWCLGHNHDCQQFSLLSHMPDSSSHNDRTTSTEIIKVASNTLWPEYEIANEDESEFDDEMNDDSKHVSSLVSRNGTDDSIKSLLESFEGDSDKKSWVSFQDRIAKAPGQILRYCRSAGAKPLWPKSSGRPTKDDIPNCSYCGVPLIFEFQILPQLLYYFGVKNDMPDSLDWATIAVYTCEASCEANVGYREEFAWIQLY